MLVGENTNNSPLSTNDAGHLDPPRLKPASRRYVGRRYFIDENEMLHIIYYYAHSGLLKNDADIDDGLHPSLRYTALSGLSDTFSACFYKIVDDGLHASLGMLPLQGFLVAG